MVWVDGCGVVTVVEPNELVARWRWWLEERVGWRKAEVWTVDGGPDRRESHLRTGRRGERGSEIFIMDQQFWCIDTPAKIWMV